MPMFLAEFTLVILVVSLVDTVQCSRVAWNSENRPYTVPAKERGRSTSKCRNTPLIGA